MLVIAGSLKRGTQDESTESFQLLQRLLELAHAVPFLVPPKPICSLALPATVIAVGLDPGDHTASYVLSDHTAILPT
jgi:hypothetical protein